MKKQVLFITGTAYCGSTLLSLILGSHFRCFSIGEVSNLPRLHKKSKKICSICPNSCAFWESFNQSELEQLSKAFSNQRLHAYIPLKLERHLRSFLRIDRVFQPYTAIFSKLPEAIDILIDSTKVPGWISQEILLPEFERGTLDAKLLYLVRDGRAVMASYLRRNIQNRTAEKFSHYWLRRTLDAQSLFNKFPENQRILIQYEELALQPEQTLKAIASFLGIDFRSEMIQYWKHEHHFISGNNETRSLIAKYKALEEPLSKPQLEQDSQKDSKETEFKIELDARWKRELSLEQLSIFEKIAGKVNQFHAWDDD